MNVNLSGILLFFQFLKESENWNFWILAYAVLLIWFFLKLDIGFFEVGIWEVREGIGHDREVGVNIHYVTIV